MAIEGKAGEEGFEGTHHVLDHGYPVSLTLFLSPPAVTKENHASYFLVMFLYDDFLSQPSDHRTAHLIPFVEVIALLIFNHGDALSK